MHSSQNQQQREALFTRLYLEVFPSVSSFISKRGGDLEQARDLFQEALVIYYEQVVLADQPVQKSTRGYLMGVTRHLWYKRQNKELKCYSLDDLGNELPDEKASVTSSQKLMRVLETTGKKCMDMLRAFYYEQLPLEQIAGQFGFGSVRSATVQKYKCLEKVRDEVKEKSMTYADFTE